MHRLLYILILLLPLSNNAQERLGAGQYPLPKTDCNYCDSIKKAAQYYSLKIKYPLSSDSLARRANREVPLPAGIQEAVVTVRFIVNCKGEPGCFHIYEVDEIYQPTRYPKNVSEGLHQFVKKLGNWPIGKYSDTEKEADYYAYLSFRIKNGKITHVIP